MDLDGVDEEESDNGVTEQGSITLNVRRTGSLNVGKDVVTYNLPETKDNLPLVHESGHEEATGHGLMENRDVTVNVGSANTTSVSDGNLTHITTGRLGETPPQVESTPDGAGVQMSVVEASGPYQHCICRLRECLNIAGNSCTYIQIHITDSLIEKLKRQKQGFPEVAVSTKGRLVSLSWSHLSPEIQYNKGKIEVDIKNKLDDIKKNTILSEMVLNLVADGASNAKTILEEFLEKLSVCIVDICYGCIQFIYVGEINPGCVTLIKPILERILVTDTVSQIAKEAIELEVKVIPETAGPLSWEHTTYVPRSHLQDWKNEMQEIMKKHERDSVNEIKKMFEERETNLEQKLSVLLQEMLSTHLPRAEPVLPTSTHEQPSHTQMGVSNLTSSQGSQSEAVPDHSDEEHAPPWSQAEGSTEINSEHDAGRPLEVSPVSVLPVPQPASLRPEHGDDGICSPLQSDITTIITDPVQTAGDAEDFCKVLCREICSSELLETVQNFWKNSPVPKNVLKRIIQSCQRKYKSGYRGESKSAVHGMNTVLCLDVSDSMEGTPVKELVQDFMTVIEENTILEGNPLEEYIALVVFGEKVNTKSILTNEFQSISELIENQGLQIGGKTPLLEALLTSLFIIRERPLQRAESNMAGGKKQAIQERHHKALRPRIVLVTDGCSTEGYDGEDDSVDDNAPQTKEALKYLFTIVTATDADAAVDCVHVGDKEKTIPILKTISELTGGSFSKFDTSIMKKLGKHYRYQHVINLVLDRYINASGTETLAEIIKDKASIYKLDQTEQKVVLQEVEKYILTEGNTSRSLDETETQDPLSGDCINIRSTHQLKMIPNKLGDNPCLSPGDLVKKGKDWHYKHGDSSSDLFKCGAVIRVEHDGTVEVKWNGSEIVDKYRYGMDNKFEVARIDTTSPHSFSSQSSVPPSSDWSEDLETDGDLFSSVPPSSDWSEDLETDGDLFSSVPPSSDWSEDLETDGDLFSSVPPSSDRSEDLETDGAQAVPTNTVSTAIWEWQNSDNLWEQFTGVQSDLLEREHNKKAWSCLVKNDRNGRSYHVNFRRMSMTDSQDEQCVYKIRREERR